MMSSWALRNFLLKQPRPDLVRMRLPDGEVQELKPTNRGRSLHKTAMSIHAMAPERVECLDAEGRILRAIRTDVEPSTSEDAPTAPGCLTDDPETARLTHFANLLHRAYEHSTSVAFTKLIELVERAETAYRESVSTRIKEAFDRVEETASTLPEDSTDRDAMMMALFQGLMQGQRSVPKPPDAPPPNNGKAKA